MQLTLILSLFLCVLLYFTVRLLRGSPHSALPPGPPGYPIIGNIYDIDREEWKTYKQLSEKYSSDVIYLNLCGTPLIVVNTLQAARDLFEKRSTIYSERPRYPMMNELMGFDWNIAFMPYGESWREHRKIFRKQFEPPATLLYRPVELDAARKLLVHLLQSPSDFVQHLRHMAGRIILSAGYGIDIQPKDDPYVAISEKALNAMAAAGNAGSYLVDVIPALKYLPECLPGAGFKKQAKEWRKSIGAMPILPFEFVTRSVADGTAKSSIASRVLADMDSDGVRNMENVTRLQNVLATMYSAGADTTVSALHTFILAMVQYPEIQKKAQRAIDDVVGVNRLPDFTDQHLIPYVDALLKEVLRWKPVTPLAIPHRLKDDNVYNRYHIPAGSIVVGNAWAMLYDESTYGPNTDQFNPERFLQDGALNPDVPHPDVAFGFGRRKCAGQDMAETSIWITIASILSTFDISKAVDQNGITIEPSGKYTSGMLCHPHPFECTIRPRVGRENLIQYAELNDGV